MTRERCFGILLVTAALVGCGRVDYKQPVDGTAGNAPVVPHAAPTAAEVDAVVASWEQTQKMVERHKGKIVVLDVWSTWCAPCKKEFPHLVALQERHPEQVVCMSFNIDYTGLADETPESHRDEVLAFLTQVGATFENIISSDPDEKLLSELQLDAVPAVYVYDADGNLKQRFDNTTRQGEEFSYEQDIVPLVEELLGLPAGERDSQ